MHQSLASLLSLALLVSSTAAAPTAEADSYAKVHRVPTGSDRQKNGPIAVEKVYRKYGWDMPPGLSEAASSAREKISTTQSNSGGAQAVQNLAQGQPKLQSIGSITATPQQHNSEYLCPIHVGQQELQLDLDTGSSDL